MSFGKYKVVLSIIFLALHVLSYSQKKDYSHRWVYAFGATVETEEGLNKLKEIADSAVAHNLNGFVLIGREDRIDNRPSEYLDRLIELDTYLKSKDLELIPAIMSFSWGDALYENDRNLTTGLHVKEALFSVQDGIAKLNPDFNVTIKNGKFTKQTNNKINNWLINDKAEELLFIDNIDNKNGRQGLCVNINNNFPNEHPILTQKIEVQPNKLYKITYRFKLKKLINNQWGVFPVQVTGDDGRQLHYQIPKIIDDNKWKEIIIGFNSLEYTKVNIVISSPASQNAKFWINDITIEEGGLINVLRRPGTPVIVCNNNTQEIYTEGVDYAKIIDSYRIDSTWNESIDFRFDHKEPSIKILPNSLIKDGDKLRVSWYHPMYIYGGAFPLCMSEQKVYNLLSKKVKLLHNAIAPQKYLLGIEEVRGGNTCALCKERNISMSEMVGKCVDRCVGIIREENADAQFYMWGDLFDPYHNGGEQKHNNYFHVNGDFNKSWTYIPKDITIIPWDEAVMEKSVHHFDSLGFKTISGCYYDSDDDLSRLKKMLGELNKYNNHKGYIYCSWNNKFGSLGEFGDLLSPKK